MIRSTRPRGVILYQGPSLIGDGEVVAIAIFRSENPKTGNMIQVYVLDQHDHPLTSHKATREGGSSNCGTCPIASGCYVVVAQAPAQIYRAYQAGAYPAYDEREHSERFWGRSIRWGAFGDPGAIPLSTVHRINRLVDGWTGYTHQWKEGRDKRTAALARVFMLSCESRDQTDWCRENGYRSFLMSRKVEPGLTECPYASSEVQCIDCGLCCGTERGAKSVYIPPHGRNQAKIGGGND